MSGFLNPAACNPLSALDSSEISLSWGNLSAWGSLGDFSWRLLSTKKLSILSWALSDSSSASVIYILSNLLFFVSILKLSSPIMLSFYADFLALAIIWSISSSCLTEALLERFKSDTLLKSDTLSLKRPSTKSSSGSFFSSAGPFLAAFVFGTTIAEEVYSSNCCSSTSSIGQRELLLKLFLALGFMDCLIEFLRDPRTDPLTD